MSWGACQADDYCGPFDSQLTNLSQVGVKSFQKARPIKSTSNPNPIEVAISRERIESGERLIPSIA
jgi:hypothetical protein